MDLLARKTLRKRTATGLRSLRGKLDRRLDGLYDQLDEGRDYVQKTFLPRPKETRTGLLITGVAGGLIGIAAGGLALASRLGRDVAPIDRTLDAEPRFYLFRGHRVAYYERGSGRPLLLVHSINAAASAYEMRAPFANLSRDHKVYALDLLGFGASDRPAIRYHASLYIDLLADFLREVVRQPADVIASSLSAAHAVICAVREPELFRSLILVNPTGMVTLSSRPGLPLRAVESLVLSPVIGQGLFNLLVSRPSIEYYLKQAYGAGRPLDRAVVEQNYQTAHQPGARYAPAAFLGKALDVCLADALPRLTTRGLAIWSENAGYQNTDKERQAFLRRGSTLAMKSLHLEGGLPYDEQPERFAGLVRDFVDASPSPSKSASPVQQAHS